MEPIAIIGIGCRFPNSENPESFWRLLHNGVDAIAEVPKQRWDIDAYYDPQPGTPGKMSTRWGGFLEQVDEFDPSFFGISPREVERMDPQQRLALEVAWEALENAGIAPDKLSGSQTGVFMGIGNYDYCRLLTGDLSLVSAYDGTGNTLSITANRLSYILNLRGPSAIIETACSSSLVALHFACRSLQQQESNLFLVGGVSLMLSPEPFITYSHARMMASDGRCKTFDASADGYVRGEGCGVVVLKRLSDAQRDGDNILAVIKGSAVNQDGLTNGLTAPNGPSQQAVIRQALQNAGAKPEQINYIEAHGTGTSLGDPIEFKSLKAVLMQDRQPDQPCWLGSVKTNIGHLEAASGIASVIKVVLALQHKEIPPHLHLKQLNPYISLEGTTFNIPTQPQPWEPGTQSRLAGISAFGFGGTNCHVILSEAPEESKTLEVKNPDSINNERPFHILTLSAKTQESLQKLAQRYVDFLTTHPDVSLANVCFTANTGRAHFEHRLAVVAESNIQLRERLLAFATGRETTGLVSGQVNSKRRPKIAFLFTGQGSQYIDMGRQLYSTQPVFRQAIDECDKILHPYLGTSLIKLLYPDTKPEQPKLDKTAYTQPALFALEYALCQLWKSWGIEPTAVMGHSVGEYAAACVAGVFSLEDGLKLIAERARLMQALPKNGEMVAVFASSDQVQAAIQPYTQVSIAAINGPQSIVISGVSDCIEEIINSLQALGIKTKKLNVSHAFHSPLMAPMLADFERFASDIKYSVPNIKLISNVTGLAKEEIATPQYWSRHISQPVQFAQSMETLHQQGYEMFVEIGPKPILLGMGRYCLPDTKDGKSRVWLPSLYPTQQDWQQILQTLAELYVRGVSVDWSNFDSDYRRRRLQLPTYPFVRQRYWVDIPTQEKVQTPIINLLNQGDTQKLFQHLEKTEELSPSELQLLPKLLELLVKQQQVGAVPIKDWLYDTEWQLKPRKLTTQEKNEVEKKGSWLIFADLGGVGQSLAKLLREQGHDCILVYPGYSFRQKEAGTWIINPSEREDFERLFQELGIKQPLQKVIHLWGLETGLATELTISTLEQAQTLGVGSVLHLLQTLVKHNNAPRLWLVTRGAVPVASQLTNPAQAPLWGLGKVIALEHRQLWGGMVDLAPSSRVDEATKLLAEISDSQGEDHLAFRNGSRYVARLVQKQLPFQEVSLRADNTYLITGGLGALGRHVAKWMVEKGARHLVLVGRRGASSEALETLKELEQLGAKVLVACSDVSNEADLISVLEQIKTSMPPLRGIIHTAGILDDGILLQQDWERFARVMAPKLKGAWNLHKLTQELPLDFFVLFSSAASLLGSPGQGNYAAANAFMDALAHYRVSIGQPGLSINWGPWSDAGMAASLDSRQQARMAAQGMNTIATSEGLLFLEQLLGQARAQVAVLPFELSVFSKQLKLGKIPLFEKLLGETNLEVEPEIVQKHEILQKLQEASASERQKLLIAYLQDKGAQVLGLSNSDLDIDQSLQDLGFDSLMAVDLTGIIRTELQLELPIRAFVEEPTIAKLATLLIEQLNPGTPSSEVVTNVLDLGKERVLDPAITPENAYIEPTTVPTSIFLTGATGFLGAYLLQELLDQTQANIYCLVRSANIESAKIRLENNLQDYELWNENYSSRIIPVLGDLSQPLLGLSNEEFEKMASFIDTIYHNGAYLNYVYPYSKFKPINILGTQEVLRLACKTKVKPVHHISSVAVFESSAYYGKTITESDPVDCSEGIYLGYSQSKWVSEKLVQIAGERGLPITIHRPPLVSGNSRTGLWNTDGFLCRMIKGCIQMGSIMTNLDLMLDLSPVDYNSRAIVYLSRQKQSIGKAFHLQNPNLLHWRQLVDFICSMGYPMERVSYEEWLLRLSNSRENPLYPLLPFFSHKWSSEQLTYIELNQQDKRPQISCEETLAALNGTSIVCPPLDAKLLDTYFRYFIRSGFLDAPKVEVSKSNR